jgi:plasmid stability protein
MTDLVLRNIEEELVEELKLRAARNRQSPEEEHRQILRRVLRSQDGGTSFKEFLEQMPVADVDESEFERIQDRGRTIAL